VAISMMNALAGDRRVATLLALTSFRSGSTTLFSC
jgi:hypothetical protein